MNLGSPLGAMLRPMIDAMQVSPGGTPMFESPVDGATGSSATAMSKPSSSDSETYCYLLYERGHVFIPVHRTVCLMSFVY